MSGRPYKDGRFTKRSWTKDEVKNLIRSWNSSPDDKSPEDFEQEFQRPFSAIAFVVTALRKNNVPMMKRKYKGHGGWGISVLIKEVLSESGGNANPS